MESMPWVRLPCSSWLTLVRHEPNASRGGDPGVSVRITGGGRSRSVSPGSGGQTLRCSPGSPSATSYGETLPGSRPATSTSA